MTIVPKRVCPCMVKDETFNLLKNRQTLYLTSLKLNSQNKGCPEVIPKGLLHINQHTHTLCLNTTGYIENGMDECNLRGIGDK